MPGGVAPNVLSCQIDTHQNKAPRQLCRLRRCDIVTWMSGLSHTSPQRILGPTNIRHVSAHRTHHFSLVHARQRSSSPAIKDERVTHNNSKNRTRTNGSTRFQQGRSLRPVSADVSAVLSDIRVGTLSTMSILSSHLDNS